MSRFTLPAIFAAAALAAGCAGTVATRGGGYVSASTYTPDLVYVSPGVSVIADYNEPIFYSDNYYWRNDNGRWARSSYYDRGWGYASPPRAVLSIRSPNIYRNYRPSGYTVRRDSNRGRGYDRRNDRRSRPVIRDHRR